MTSMEILHKPVDPDKKKMFNRLQSYFNALENNSLEEYHKEHGRK